MSSECLIHAYLITRLNAFFVSYPFQGCRFILVYFIKKKKKGQQKMYIFQEIWISRTPRRKLQWNSLRSTRKIWISNWNETVIKWSPKWRPLPMHLKLILRHWFSPRSINNSHLKELINGRKIWYFKFPGLSTLNLSPNFCRQNESWFEKSRKNELSPNRMVIKGFL